MSMVTGLSKWMIKNKVGKKVGDKLGEAATTGGAVASMAGAKVGEALKGAGKLATENPVKTGAGTGVLAAVGLTPDGEEDDKPEGKLKEIYGRKRGPGGRYC